jgi:Zn-dependent peptidase ImmA (M78 family)
MTKSRGFDPYDYAFKLGIDVEYRSIGKNMGIWVADHNTIYLRPGMRAVHERSVLTHELGHAVLGHRVSNAKNERQANMWAAKKLINLDRLADVRRISADPAVWAAELGVTLTLLECYMQQLEMMVS